jgi:hypothetical protein
MRRDEKHGMGMRRGFVIGVLVFGALGATVLVYVTGTSSAWVWLVAFAALALLPLWIGWTDGTPEAPPHELFRRRETPPSGESGGPGRPA